MKTKRMVEMRIKNNGKGVLSVSEEINEQSTPRLGID
jgi:hypothetical protein